MTVQEFAKKHGLPEQWIRRLCKLNRIKGAVKSGKSWKIPARARIVRPVRWVWPE